MLDSRKLNRQDSTFSVEYNAVFDKQSANYTSNTDLLSSSNRNEWLRPSNLLNEEKYPLSSAVLNELDRSLYMRSP